MDNYNKIKSKLRIMEISEDIYNTSGVHVNDLPLEKKKLLKSILKNEFLHI